jgi:hypothetical protein
MTWCLLGKRVLGDNSSGAVLLRDACSSNSNDGQRCWVGKRQVMLVVKGPITQDQTLPLPPPPSPAPTSFPAAKLDASHNDIPLLPVSRKPTSATMVDTTAEPPDGARVPRRRRCLPARPPGAMRTGQTARRTRLSPSLSSSATRRTRPGRRLDLGQSDGAGRRR